MKFTNFQVKGTRMQVIKALHYFAKLGLMDAAALFNKMICFPVTETEVDDERLYKYLREEGLVNFEEVDEDEFDWGAFNKQREADFAEANSWYEKLDDYGKRMVDIFKTSGVPIG